MYISETIQEKQAGVYEIVNIRSQYVYVGSSKDILKRVKQHRSELKNQKHGNILMEEDCALFGFGTFYADVVQVVDEFDVRVRDVKLLILENQTILEFLLQGYHLYNSIVAGRGPILEIPTDATPEIVARYMRIPYLKEKYSEGAIEA